MRERGERSKDKLITGVSESTVCREQLNEPVLGTDNPLGFAGGNKLLHRASALPEQTACSARAGGRAALALTLSDGGILRI